MLTIRISSIRLVSIALLQKSCEKLLKSFLNLHSYRSYLPLNPSIECPKQTAPNVVRCGQTGRSSREQTRHGLSVMICCADLRGREVDLEAYSLLEKPRERKLLSFFYERSLQIEAPFKRSTQSRTVTRSPSGRISQCGSQWLPMWFPICFSM